MVIFFFVILFSYNAILGRVDLYGYAILLSFLHLTSAFMSEA